MSLPSLIVDVERAWFRCSGRGWSVEVTNSELTFTGRSGTVTAPSQEAGLLDVHRRWLRWQLCHSGIRVALLPGIRRAGALSFERALRRLELAPAIAAAVAWQSAVNGVVNQDP